MRSATEGSNGFGRCAANISFPSLPWGRTFFAGEVMPYRCEATSVPGFVQQVAVSYVSNGYFFYVAGSVPEGKDARAIDEKIIARYDIGISKWAKARRKSLGQANLQYIRFERFFLILATHGQHRFFQDEAKVIRDVRRVPIRFAGYSIGFRGGHASVRIERTEYKLIKSFLVGNATSWSAANLVTAFLDLRLEQYAPVRRQLCNVLRAVNRSRSSAGFRTIPYSSILAKRTVQRPFDGGIGREQRTRTAG